MHKERSWETRSVTICLVLEKMGFTLGKFKNQHFKYQKNYAESGI